jgi:hypothetical protein
MYRVVRRCYDNWGRTRVASMLGDHEVALCVPVLSLGTYSLSMSSRHKYRTDYCSYEENHRMCCVDCNAMWLCASDGCIVQFEVIYQHIFDSSPCTSHPLQALPSKLAGHNDVLLAPQHTTTRCSSPFTVPAFPNHHEY